MLVKGTLEVLTGDTSIWKYIDYVQLQWRNRSVMASQITDKYIVWSQRVSNAMSAWTNYSINCPVAGDLKLRDSGSYDVALMILGDGKVRWGRRLELTIR